MAPGMKLNQDKVVSLMYSLKLSSSKPFLQMQNLSVLLKHCVSIGLFMSTEMQIIIDIEVIGEQTACSGKGLIMCLEAFFLDLHMLPSGSRIVKLIAGNNMCPSDCDVQG